MYDLGELYAEFNAKYFNGELPVLPFESKVDKNGEVRHRYGTLKWDGRLGKSTLGTYKRGTICLNRSIASDPNKTRSVLLHEMLHKYLDFKGLDDGPVGVYGKQALVLVHRGGGSAVQLMTLAREIQDAVHARFGVRIEPEPVVV